MLQGRDCPRVAEPSRQTRLTLAGAAAAAGVALIGACGSGGGWQGVYQGREDGAVTGGVAQPDSRTLLSRAAIDLEEALAQTGASSANSAEAEPPVAASAAAPAPGAADEAPISVGPPETPRIVALDDPEPEPAPLPPPSPEAVIADLSGRIAQVLGHGLRPEEEPLRQAARLLALDLISHGAAEPELNALREQMLPPQQEAFDALRALFRELADSSTLDQAQVAELLWQQIEALPRGRPLRISDLRLCSEVVGFGRFAPMSATFAAGRSHAALVYVEVVNFKERRFDSARDGWSGVEDPTAERWVAELGQEITLLDDRNDHVALHKPEQVVRDIARRKRSDFYIVQRIDLPAQLAIGKYHLKVTLRDMVDGAAVAEKVIPIEIAAR